jgi:glucose/arabinose dehydrogenase
MLRSAFLLVPALVLPLVSVARTDEAVTSTEHGPVRLVTVVEGLEHPWGMAFLPDGRVLVTEKPGRLRIVTAQGTVGPALRGVPAVDADGQGGLLDVALDPDFSSNRLVYVSMPSHARVATVQPWLCGRLGDDGLTDVQVIFRQQPTVESGHHFGSRLVFARDGRLFVTLGERNSARAQAQTLDSHIGKVVRIERDGKVPADNPFVGRTGALAEIWSYGHRNVQGAALHPGTGELWTNEHGPKGGDELNRTLAGRNYGWPVIGYGRHYNLTKIGEGNAKAGMEQPVTYWDPSIATSGMAFYTGTVMPAWRGSLFVGGLAARQVRRLELSGERVVGEEQLFQGFPAHQDGARADVLHLLTDEPNAGWPVDRVAVTACRREDGTNPLAS